MQPTLTDPPSRLAYATTEPAPPGAMVEVAPGVHWVRMPLPFALDHINLWVLDDGDEWTLVDTGIGRDEVRAIWDTMFSGALAGRPVRRIVVTHFHPDHFGLAGWLQERTGAPVWMTRTEWAVGNLVWNDAEGRLAAAQAAFFRRHGLDAGRAGALESRGNAYRRLVSPPPSEFRRVRDGEILDIGDHRWRVVVGTGHAPEHACLWCSSLGVLIAGDQVLPRITPNVSLPATEPDSDPLAEYLATLEILRDLPPATLVLPSHDLPFTGLHERLDSLGRHHAQHLAALEGVLAAGARSAADLLPVMFPRRRLDTHQTMFAMGECLSHLARLVREGRAARETHADGVVRFRACEGLSRR